MEDFEENDEVIVDDKRLGTIIYIYSNGHTMEVEYTDNEIETVSINRIKSA